MVGSTPSPGATREIPMNEPGHLSPDAAASDAVAETKVVRRPYVAPAIVAFGSVEEFTRGTGSSSTLDANRTTRVRAR